jgi:hypothetical protein
MMADAKFHWSGWGKWLSLALATLLIFLAIPLMLHRTTGAAAGWNLFLGLLIFGSVVSENKRTPLLVVIIAALMLIRLIITIIADTNTPDVVASSLLALLACGAAFDLRRQGRVL